MEDKALISAAAEPQKRKTEILAPHISKVAIVYSVLEMAYKVATLFFHH